MKLQTCPASQQLQRLVDGDLDEHTEAAVEEHLSTCELCRSQVEQQIQSADWWQQARSSLRSSSQESVNSDTDEPPHGDVLSLLGPTDDPDKIGRIAEYEVIGIIGRGGMGVVFKAFDPRLNRFVAIKMLLPHMAVSGVARKRFAREGQAAAAVVDDFVLPIYAVAEWKNVPYLVTQYSRGTTLQKRVHDEGPLELKEILRLGMQTSRGLAAAHAQGLVHRDVKPSNILLDGNVDRAMLTDFGLARAADDASITRTGVIAGTPQYMSPEQARGQSVDARSDLFSLGCVLYFLCTGQCIMCHQGKSGTIELKWSRVERRFNGTWQMQDQKSTGKLSLQPDGVQIHGAWTTKKDSDANEGTPRLADLVWKRNSENSPVGIDSQPFQSMIESLPNDSAIDDTCTSTIPPDETRILLELEKQRGLKRESIYWIHKDHKDRFLIIVKPVYDKLVPVRDYPVIGRASLHLLRYECTVKFSPVEGVEWPLKKDGKPEYETTFFVDSDHLHRETTEADLSANGVSSGIENSKATIAPDEPADKTTGLHRPLDRKNPDSVVEAWVAAVIAKDVAKASRLESGHPAEADQIEAWGNNWDPKNFSGGSVKIDDQRSPPRALVVFASQEFAAGEPSKDQSASWSIVFELMLLDGDWFVTRVTPWTEDVKAIAGAFRKSPSMMGTSPTELSALFGGDPPRLPRKTDRETQLTLADAVKAFNEQSANDRRTLFNPPIPDMTEDQLRDGFVETAKYFRESGESQLADTLQKIADTRQIPKESPTGVFAGGIAGQGLEGGNADTKQIAPALSLPNGRGHDLYVLLRSLQLIYNRNAKSSLGYGELVADGKHIELSELQGRWRLVMERNGGDDSEAILSIESNRASVNPKDDLTADSRFVLHLDSIGKPQSIDLEYVLGIAELTQLQEPTDFSGESNAKAIDFYPLRDGKPVALGIIERTEKGFRICMEHTRIVGRPVAFEVAETSGIWELVAIPGVQPTTGGVGKD